MRQIWITKASPPEVLQVREAPAAHQYLHDHIAIGEDYLRAVL